MGNQCTGKSKQSKEKFSSKPSIKVQESPPSLKNTENQYTTYPNQIPDIREGTTTSYEDIRKVYQFEPQIIGHGQFGAVRLATAIRDQNQKNKKIYAVKTISKEKLKRDLQMLKVELEIMKNLDHPNIIKFYETYQDQKFFHLVMEYCSGGELFERIVSKEHFSEKETIQLMQKIVSAVNYLHKNGIVHRDLKPENFLFVNDSMDSEIKIIDFGLSQQINQGFSAKEQKLSDIVGTALYIAPEVLKGNYNESCDMWSLGVITYILLCGNPPFKGKTNQEIFQQIQDTKPIAYEKSDWKKISQQGINFVQSLLNRDPQQRMTAQQAIDHPWLNKNKIKINDEDKGNIDPSIINIMKNFRSVGKFKKEVLKVVVNQLTEQEIKRLRAQFRSIDRGRTGYISLNELRNAINKVGHNDTDIEIFNMMKKFNVNPNARAISYTTFIGTCLDKNTYLTAEKLYPVFQQFDIDGTGYITKENLKEAMARTGRKLNSKDLEELIKDFDLTNDQTITWEEFLKIMTMDKDEDLQSVKESLNYINTQDITTNRNQNQSFGNLGIEVSNYQQSQNETNQQGQKQDLSDVSEVEIQVVLDKKNQFSQTQSQKSQNQGQKLSTPRPNPSPNLTRQKNDTQENMNSFTLNNMSQQVSAKQKTDSVRNFKKKCTQVNEDMSFWGNTEEGAGVVQIQNLEVKEIYA